MHAASGAVDKGGNTHVFTWAQSAKAKILSTDFTMAALVDSVTDGVESLSVNGTTSKPTREVVIGIDLGETESVRCADVARA